MIDDAVASLRDMFTPPFRAVLLKSLGLTPGAARRAVAGAGAPEERADDLGAHWFAARPGSRPWSRSPAALGLFVGLIFLIAPVAMLVAGFFLDELADHVEAKIYPPGRRGRAAPALTSMALALKFSGVALAVNLVAFALWLLPGVNALVFFVANAYLFGREYFQLAAMRYRPLEEAQALAPPPSA